MHLVLTGATGLVGSAVLQTVLATPAISKISILSRRPVAQAEGHAKARVILHKDFAEYADDVLDGLKDVKGVVWALGISATQVGKECVSPYRIYVFLLSIWVFVLWSPEETKPRDNETQEESPPASRDIANLTSKHNREYERIHLTYPLSFARALSKTTSPSPLTFIYVSGEGATPTPSILTAHWAFTKGRAESSLLALSKDPAYNNLRPFSVRPGGVDMTDHEEIHGFVGRGQVVERVLLPVLRVLPGVKGLMSPTRELGTALVGLAVGDGEVQEGGGVSGEGRTLNNAALRRSAGI